jgi:beta-mannosidase
VVYGGIARMGLYSSYAFLTQVLQSEAVSFAYRSWRREWRGAGKEYVSTATELQSVWHIVVLQNGGTLVWQSNDCWPVTSWAIADYFVSSSNR